MTAIRVTQAFRREQHNARDFAELAWGFRDSRLRAQRYMGTFFPFVEFLGTLSTAAVLVVGAGQVRFGELSAGTLIAFLLYVELFFSPIQQLSQVFDGYQQAVIGLGRLRSLMRTPAGTPAAEQPLAVGRLRGEVEFDEVSFGYAGAAARRSCTGCGSASPPARPSPWSGRPARASPPSSSCWPASTTRPQGPYASTATTCATSTRPATGAASASSPRSPISSAAPCGTPSPTGAPKPPTPKWRAPPARWARTR